MSGVPKDAASLRFRAPSLQNCSQACEHREAVYSAPKNNVSISFVPHHDLAAPVCPF